MIGSEALRHDIPTRIRRKGSVEVGPLGSSELRLMMRERELMVTTRTRRWQRKHGSETVRAKGNENHKPRAVESQLTKVNRGCNSRDSTCGTTSARMFKE